MLKFPCVHLKKYFSSKRYQSLTKRTINGTAYYNLGINTKPKAAHLTGYKPSYSVWFTNSNHISATRRVGWNKTSEISLCFGNVHLHRPIVQDVFARRWWSKRFYSISSTLHVLTKGKLKLWSCKLRKIKIHFYCGSCNTFFFKRSGLKYKGLRISNIQQHMQEQVGVQNKKHFYEVTTTSIKQKAKSHYSNHHQRNHWCHNPM